MEPTVQKYDFNVKLKMIGDTAVGKSSILLRFCQDEFSEDMTPTIGVDYKSKTFEMDGKIVKTVIWDTAGQERFRTITANYYRGSNGIIFVYDVTRRESFESISGTWLPEAKSYFPNNDVMIMLIGNKIDSDDRVVEKEEA